MNSVTPVGRGMILLVRGYQRFISPMLPASCRFVPSCSEYATMAIEEWGAVRGVFLSLWRILRCQPLCRGGLDLPPSRQATPSNGDIAETNH